MPTKRELDIYRKGIQDGLRMKMPKIREDVPDVISEFGRDFMGVTSPRRSTGPKRKLSAWQKYIKNKRNHIKYRDGKLNLKKMGVAFRRKQRR